MANGSYTAPGLSFPRETFAKLTPGPFLLAHLKQPEPIRANGRSPEGSRTPTVNTGSLTHSNGSAVVRVGDTAIVCGVRAENLLVSDISEEVEEIDLVSDLGLLVPNLELSTGCSPQHLPGNAPGTLAQSLTYRLSSLLNASNLVSPSDLAIQYTEPQTEDDEAPRIVTRAYWTLYIDVLCIALDGNAFDAAWASVIAALQNTVLPKAWWDPDREAVICSPLTAEAHRLHLNGLPIASTFAIFSMTSPLKQRSEPEFWILADPDAFEESICKESLTIVIAPNEAGRAGIIRLDKIGQTAVGKVSMQQCLRMAEDRWTEWKSVMGGTQPIGSRMSPS